MFSVFISHKYLEVQDRYNVQWAALVTRFSFIPILLYNIPAQCKPLYLLITGRGPHQSQEVAKLSQSHGSEQKFMIVRKYPYHSKFNNMYMPHFLQYYMLSHK